MAMGLLQKMVSKERAKWCISSAGIWADYGHPPAQNTLSVLRDRGIDIGDSLSRQVTEDMLEANNLILTMERGQKEALKAAFPEHASRIHLLSEMAGKTNDIVDPVGRPLTDYEHTAQEIDQILSQGIKRIHKLALG
jgi:protein-tyrosine phosphatase